MRSVSIAQYICHGRGRVPNCCASSRCRARSRARACCAGTRFSSTREQRGLVQVALGHVAQEHPERATRRGWCRASSGTEAPAPRAMASSGNSRDQVAVDHRDQRHVRVVQRTARLAHVDPLAQAGRRRACTTPRTAARAHARAGSAPSLERVEHALGDARRLDAARHVMRSAALRDRALEQPARGGQREQRRDAHRARGLTEQRDLPGIAAERLDVLAHPAQRGELIAQPVVRIGRRSRPRRARPDRRSRARRAGS